VNSEIKRITSIDVAKAAGVSQSTVSRTFSGGKVSSIKRDRVLAAAAKLRYSPNGIARSLITQQTHIIGFVLAGMSSPFNAYMMQKFASRLQEIGYQLLVFTAEKEDEIDALLARVLQYRVDALIITAASLSSEMADICAATNTPVILFNRLAKEADASIVACDNYAGGKQVAAVLIDAGHERLAYIAGPAHASTNAEREAGFVNGLTQKKMTLFRRGEAFYSYQSGYAAAKQLLTAAKMPDAIFCASDVIAVGALDCARDMDVDVPNELSIIGFDDIPEAAWSAYALTTMRLPVNRMIDGTISLLECALAAPTKPETQIFPPVLIKRESANI